MRQLEPIDIWELKLPSTSPHVNSSAAAGKLSAHEASSSPMDALLSCPFMVCILRSGLIGVLIAITDRPTPGTRRRLAWIPHFGTKTRRLLFGITEGVFDAYNRRPCPAGQPLEHTE